VLNTFIEDVVKSRNAGSAATVDFLQDQQEHYRGLLRGVELSIEQFKREHPEYSISDRGGYFTRLQKANESVAALQREYSVEERKFSELKRQLNSSNPYIVPDGEVSSLFIPGQETARRVSELTRARSELLLRVTSKHPDVRAMDEQLKLLRRELDAELLGNRGEDGVEASNSNNPVYQQIQLAMSESNVRLAEMGSQLEAKQREVNSLNALIDTAPKLEREFTALNRDYKKYQGLYDEVLVEAERERIGRVGETTDCSTGACFSAAFNFAAGSVSGRIGYRGWTSLFDVAAPAGVSGWSRAQPSV